jgi:hypothetical protein
MAESKDQRRTRLKNEGKALLAAGRHNEVTPQHQAAMDYFTRKNASKSAKEKEANAAKKTTSAISSDVITKQSKGYIADPITLQGGREKAELIKGSVFSPQSRILSVNTRAINEDNTHHAMMGTLADHLSSKLDEAHSSGKLLAEHAKNIDDRLSIAYQNLAKSNNAHDRGDVAGAKQHMEHAANAVYSAAAQMESKGIKLTSSPEKNIGAMALKVGGDYIHSTTPGVGAMPHEKFRKRVGRYTVASGQEADAKPEPKSGTTAKTLASSYDSLPEDDRDWSRASDYEPSATSGSVMRNQLKELGFGESNGRW